ncbi:MAG: asparagine synthase (glutamine-hydrolyzing), partial [Bacillota bacterium]
MCGIAGWINFDPNITKEQSVINRMFETLKNRGPDESDVYAGEEALLMHSRLIVIDPEGGKQPMTIQTAEDTFTIVYNGELYNTDKIREKLVNIGYSFRGYSDTEVILTAFAHWKEKCVEFFNGIFAFGIWQHKRKRLFLARDRIGVKPLFFYRYKDGILFASEIKTLLQNPLVKRKIDDNGLMQIMYLGPGRIPGNGIIKDVSELKSGEYMYYYQDNIQRSFYWKLKAKEHKEDLSDTVFAVKDMVIDSIKRQMVADEDVSCLLSGGLDSSIICAVVGGEYGLMGKRLKTFSAAFEDNEKYFKENDFQPQSDDKYIKIMSNYLNSEHTNIVMKSADVALYLNDAVYARDLPGMADIDSSLLLFGGYLKNYTKVCLSGECADEIFAGYPWYHKEEMLNSPTFPWSKAMDMRKTLFNYKDLSKKADAFVMENYQNTIKQTEYGPNDTVKDRRVREMFMLNFHWFMQTLLDRKDRMTMYNGLETRVPFCDYRLVEYAFNMPWEYKYHNNREKGILREAFKNFLPEEIGKRKKSPFPKTMNPAYLKSVKKLLNEKLENKNSV